MLSMLGEAVHSDWGDDSSFIECSNTFDLLLSSNDWFTYFNMLLLGKYVKAKQFVGSQTPGSDPIS